MSRRRNGTSRAGAALGLSMYGPMNTGKKKRPRGAGTPTGHYKTTYRKNCSR